MFVDEALTTAALQHPNIVRYLDAGSDAHGPWMCLEWVDGLSAQELHRQRRAPMTPGAVLALAQDLLAALAAAHGPATAVIHRDVSLANVLVGRDGIARLADFGLARSLARPRAHAVGTARGKIGYLAPEVLHGALHGTRADLYATGVVLWELLAGRRLFSGVARRAELPRAYLSSPRPALRTVNPEVPAAFAAVIDRALSLDPADRPPSALAMAQDLDAAAAVADLTASREELSVAVWGALTLARRTATASIVPAPAPAVAPAPPPAAVRPAHRSAPVRTNRPPRRVVVMGVAMEVA